MANEWESGAAMLVITKDDLDSSEVTRHLGIAPSVTIEPRNDRSFKDGAGIWSIIVDQSAHKSTPGQIKILEDTIEPIHSQLSALRDNGYSAEVIITGRVERIHQVPLDVATLQSLYRLGLPVSFTTRRAPTDEDAFWAELGI